jgi:uncharacterized RDD family membrane protein YckC
MSSTIPMSSAGAGAYGTAVISTDQLAGRGTRLIAKIIDSVIVGVLWIPSVLGMMSAMATAAAAGEAGMEDPSGLIALIFGSSSISILLTLVYAVVQAWLLTKDGQTIGKKLTKIRIVKMETGQNGGFVTNVVMRFFVNYLINSITGGLYGIVDALFIFRDDRRCAHDLIAGTTVVRADA